MNNDYRITIYCEPIIDLENKKKSIAETIKKDYPKAKNMHTYISNNKKPYKKTFVEAYNFRCAYCGASIEIFPLEIFQIDHFIYEKSFEKKVDAGFIENLVLACPSCNHRKGALPLPKEDREYLNPDTEAIKKTFKRDELYYIVISEEFKTNKTVKQFYETLGLGEELHRLDYLLLNMIAFQSKLKRYNVMLARAIDILRVKRNIMRNLKSSNDIKEVV